MKRIFVISGPSGVGKTSIVNEVLKNGTDNLKQVISYTTRAIRENEEDCVHYHFIDREKFLEMETKGDFVESAEVFGNKYGVSRSNIENILKTHNVLLVINWKGFIKIKELFPRETFGIFIDPPSINELENRIKNRATDSQEEIAKRLSLAQQDISHANIYNVRIVNDDLETSAKDLQKIIEKERNKQY